jgi:hypothetical protein
MSWWVYTDPSSTGTCERCKRSAAEHTWVCIACATARRPNARLAAGDQKSFSLHTYKDHVRMVNSSTPRCDCPKDAIPAPPPVPTPEPGAVSGGPQVQMSREEHIRAAMERARANAAALAGGQAPPEARVTVRAPNALQCGCSGCGGCTGGTSCFRPPDGDQGRCIVCSFLGPKAAPKASAASTMPAPPEVEGVEESPSAKPVSNAVRVEVDVVVVPSDER